MKKNATFTFVSVFLILLTSCTVPKVIQVQNTQQVPPSYANTTDTTNIAMIKWEDYFNDPYLSALIDTALANNYELLSTLQNLEIAKNYIRIKHAQLLPQVDAAIGMGLEKAGRYTAAGAGNASTDMTPGKKVPEPIGDIFIGFKASWEIDIWDKLKNAEKAAYIKYLASIEGKNFLVTNLVAEIANTYYELLASDSQLDIIKQSIALQKKQLEVLKIQKEAAKVTELAVKLFDAQLYNAQSKLYDVAQSITENENKINYLLGRFPQPIPRDKNILYRQLNVFIQQGIPVQLLQNRPDVKQAELELQATWLEVKIARAEFLPTVSISGLLGLQGYKPKFVLPNIENLAFNIAGELAAPVVNRNAIIANYKNANAAQIAALYNYQKSIVNGFMEVYNQMSNIKNLEDYYRSKNQEVETLSRSAEVASKLFEFARADYLEVLTVQRDALASKLELIEVNKNKLNAITNIYKALGGGWR